MSNSRKEQIKESLRLAKQEGVLRAERIRELIKSAVSQAASEVKEGSGEIRSLVKDAISAVIETLQETKGEIQEEITASIEGVVEGISDPKRQELSQTQAEVKQLQAKLETDEEKVQKEIDSVLTEIQETGDGNSEQIKAAIKSAINNIKDTEEVAVLQKRYAQLKAQLAIIQANLASRYGERFEDVSQYLDEAKTWYERAKADPEVFTDKVEHKRVAFEDKMSKAGASIARKERDIKHHLKELWVSMTELFRDKQSHH